MIFCFQIKIKLQLVSIPIQIYILVLSHGVGKEVLPKLAIKRVQLASQSN